MYEIVIGSHAKQDLKKIKKFSSETHFKNIETEIRGLVNKAGEDKERKIVQSVRNCWRIKVKDWRILYKVDEPLKKVYVLRIVPRKEAYDKKVLKSLR